MDARKKKDSISSFTPVTVLRSIFIKYDLDYDGYLTIDELIELFQQDVDLGKDQSELCAYLLDTKGANSVSFDEFNIWIKTGDRLSNIKDASKFSLLKSALEMFRKYDIDGNHAIDGEEFKKLLIDTGGDLNSFQTAFEHVDLDGNKKVTFSEFLHWLNWVSSDEFLSPLETMTDSPWF